MTLFLLGIATGFAIDFVIGIIINRINTKKGKKLIWSDTESEVNHGKDNII